MLGGILAFIVLTIIYCIVWAIIFHFTESDLADIKVILPLSAISSLITIITDTCQ